MKIVNALITALLIVAPAFSAGAAEIVFAGDRDGQFDLFTVDPATSQVNQLTASPGDDSMPAVSVDGSNIAFVSNRAGADSLYLMPRNASGVEDISAGVGAYANPAFAPDGTRIAVRYAPDPQSPLLDTQIVLLDPKTRKQEILVDSTRLKTSENSDATVVVDRPVWVSNTLFAYLIAEYSDPEVGRLTKSTIYMYDLDKREQTRVAGGESYFSADGNPMGFKASMPTLINDGDQGRALAFTAIRGGTNREPMKIALSGGGKGVIALDDPDFFGPLLQVGDLWAYGYMDDESNFGLAWRSIDLKTPRTLLQFKGKIITPAVMP